MSTAESLEGGGHEEVRTRQLVLNRRRGSAFATTTSDDDCDGEQTEMPPRDPPSRHERNETVTSDLTSQFVVTEGLANRGPETGRCVHRLAV